ncbi:hypothetical protein ACPFUC_001889 [Vibrio cholerae]|jgi:hypothetical protein|uniref:hypothetical protein n=1 Tax=Vibrio fluvialis TaxID=676 RepID=UPI0025723882|nr:hypothetical protein [Vibrio fluvialis]BEI26566.1 hypothetical protein KKIDH5335_48980 [Vibrio fluvialis]
MQITQQKMASGTKAYDEGEQAYRQQRDRKASNPYEICTIERDCFNTGYDDARDLAER